MHKKIIESDTEEDFREAFKVFDADGDQLISKEKGNILKILISTMKPKNNTKKLKII